MPINIPHKMTNNGLMAAMNRLQAKIDLAAAVLESRGLCGTIRFQYEDGARKAPKRMVCGLEKKYGYCSVCDANAR